MLVHSCALKYLLFSVIFNYVANVECFSAFVVPSCPNVAILLSFIDILSLHLSVISDVHGLVSAWCLFTLFSRLYCFSFHHVFLRFYEQHLSC